MQDRKKELINTGLLVVIIVILCVLANELLSRSTKRTDMIATHDSMVSREIKQIHDELATITGKVGRKSITIYTDLPHVEAPKAPPVKLHKTKPAACSGGWFQW